MSYKIIFENKIKCNRCGEVIESASHHDFKTCKCGHCSIDGGHDYFRRGWTEGVKDFEDLSCQIEVDEETYLDFRAFINTDKTNVEDLEFYKTEFLSGIRGLFLEGSITKEEHDYVFDKMLDDKLGE